MAEPEAPKRPGRRPLPPEQRRANLGLSLSQSSIAALRALSDQHGMTQSDFVEYLLTALRGGMPTTAPPIAAVALVRVREPWRRLPRLEAAHHLAYLETQFRAQAGYASGIVFTRSWGPDTVLQIWSFENVAGINALNAIAERMTEYFEVTLLRGIMPARVGDTNVFEPLLAMTGEFSDLQIAEAK